MDTTEYGMLRTELEKYSDNKFDAITTDMDYKGSVASASNLPASGTVGDVYTTADTGARYVWDGTQWTKINGITIDSALSDSSTNPVQNKVVTEALSSKYTKYVASSVSGLSLDMFDICPTQYSIVQYDNTDALQHSNIGTLKYLFGRLKREYDDIHFKVHYGMQYNGVVRFAVAMSENYAIALDLNLTSGYINLFVPNSTTYTYVSAPSTRNANCRTIVDDDELHFVRDGSKVALYLVDNGTDVPIYTSEWFDVEPLLAGDLTTNDITFGLSTSNSARGEPLLYDFSYETSTGDHFMDYDEVDGRLDVLEDALGVASNMVDLFLFMGQSNIAGRGLGNQAPEVIEGAGYEFRAITDPSKLYPITEPFGVNENVDGAINDVLGGQNAKSGDLVPSFVNAYYTYSHHTIVGVSASEGGTQIAYWQPNTDRYNDAVSRYEDAIEFLTENGFDIRHKYILWCQGESNGDIGTSKADYKSAFSTMANAWFENGIEKIFVIKIGNYNGSGTQDYNTIMTAQNEICQETPDVVMVSTDFASMKDRNLMKDDYHYKQEAYNEVGTYSGINTAIYVTTGKEPTMYDTQNDTLYYSHKN